VSEKNRQRSPGPIPTEGAFLVSDAADWMRGEIVTFDGGE
jgi:hypothetical protein